jgi:Xaa-Pro dipeptidase
MSDFERYYRPHLDIIMGRAAQALDAAGLESILIYSGGEKMQFLDDQPYAFRTNPHFKAWIPLTQHPHCWLYFRPGDRPLVIYSQPEDFWHVPPAEPQGYWVDEYDLAVVRSPDQAYRLLPRETDRVAVIAEDEPLMRSLGFQHINPKGVLNHLHYHRAKKTPYELLNMRGAALRAARGHVAAEAAFRNGKCEHEIHLDYLRATLHTEAELPYNNIIALNDNAAVLHYNVLNRATPSRVHSFLIDAGASYLGYAADISRTYAARDDDFQQMINSMNTIQLKLVSEARAGVKFTDLHHRAHEEIGQFLYDQSIVKCSPAAAVESGLTSVFFPHGLGHLLGLQVHDVGGHMADISGAELPRPAQHPYLRLTRTLEPGFVVTIEPGVYFIDSLMREAKKNRYGNHINWSRVRDLRRFGGIRIEDDVVIGEAEPENLTRNAFELAGTPPPPVAVPPPLRDFEED